jgi:pimeloyl-ACP methyl ester carboxylesterase
MYVPARLGGLFAVGITLLLAISASAQQNAKAPTKIPRLELQTTESDAGKISRGQLIVYEDRRARSGRQLELDVVVLHAAGKAPQPDPIFFLEGGPGKGAAVGWQRFPNLWMRSDRDVVLMNQRGTGGSNRLTLPSQRNQDLQGFLDPPFRTDQIDEAIAELGKNADLRMYSTPDAMDDLNDLREALGYEQVNLVGGSYGTRAALVYIRRHEKTVRTAILNGVAPIEFRNPPYHAQSAQYALDKIFQRVEEDPVYRKAFPELRKKFHEILERLEDNPVKVDVTVVGTGEVVTLNLSKDAFAASLAYQMYYMDTSRRVPLLLWQAWKGDFKPFVISAIQRNRALSQSVAMGMLLSVTAAEDVVRIRPEEIEPLTRDTFLGDVRVRQQIRACRDWPKSQLAEDFGQPVRSNVPVLILSGEIDPVTPPRWGEICAQNFPNSLHIVAPAAHGVSGACITAIEKRFLEKASVEGLDVSCVKQMVLPPLELPPDFESE